MSLAVLHKNLDTMFQEDTCDGLGTGTKRSDVLNVHRIMSTIREKQSRAQLGVNTKINVRQLLALFPQG